MTTWTTARAHHAKAARDRTVIDGQDVTYWRLTRHGDQPITQQGYSLHEPFAYGNATLTIPRVNGVVEQLGVGDRSWIKTGAKVKFERVWYDDDETTILDREVDYVGVVVAVRIDGINVSLDIVGNLEGRLALQFRMPPVFRRSKDVGEWAFSTIVNSARQHLTPVGGPVTGIRLRDEGRMTQLAWLEKVCAMSQNVLGAMRTVMPEEWGSNRWTFNVKDTTTVHASVFADGARIRLDVVEDASEIPNRFYGNGQDANGMRWRNAKAPGIVSGDAPPYPIAGGASFGIGTDDGDTIGGDGISVMHARLIQMGYLDLVDAPDATTYTAAVADAVEEFQRDAHLTQTGTMTTTGWDRLFDLNVVGYSLAYAAQFPLVQDPRIPYWIHSANGSIVGKNDQHDPNLLVVDRDIDHGLASKKDGHRWTVGAYQRAVNTATRNWFGTITLNEYGVFAGSHDGTTDPGAGNLIPGRSIRPGWNIRVPYFDGDTLFHVSGVQVGADGKVTLTVDTQARDLLEVSQLIARNRESSRDIRREWWSVNRRNAPSTSMVTWDEIGGVLSYKKALPGDEWTVFPLPVGQQGQVSRTILRLVDDEAAFAVCFFATKVTKGQLASRIGNPLAVASDPPWYEDEGKLGDWLEGRWLLYAAGTEKQPAGYFPRKHTNDDGVVTSAPITGRWMDDSPWPYIMAPDDPSVLWCAIYPDRDTVIQAGRLLYKQEDDAI